MNNDATMNIYVDMYFYEFLPFTELFISYIEVHVCIPVYIFFS